jgi:hypothetical protein
MTTAIDTNILVALWNEDDILNTLARSALDDALGRGSLVISAAVFAELLAAPARNETFLDSFCRDKGFPWTGSWKKPSGALLDGHSSYMSPAGENSATPARAVSSPTS